ncbi:MAG: hypothetical protein EHM70_01605 [Chloroflexota bacterium]|nr:MAG: hypothetical protein EHM70_01605 [Chloroflexota bacterium]
MVLVFVVLAGSVITALWSRLNHRPWEVPHLSSGWMVPVALLPQWLAFYHPATRKLFPIEWAAITLVCSQVLLLIFALRNHRQPGFWLLAVGLALNLLVISLNGGLMPVDPGTAAHLQPDFTGGEWQAGTRFGWTKSLVISADEMRLAMLSDQIMLPGWFPFHAAVSPGDICIVIGAIILLWKGGSHGA